MANTRLDPIDRKILAELQADGRMTNVELAKRVGISAPLVCGGYGRWKNPGISAAFTRM